MTDDYITDDVKRLIGRESPVIEAAHAVEASEVRRFHQATYQRNGASGPMVLIVVSGKDERGSFGLVTLDIGLRNHGGGPPVPYPFDPRIPAPAPKGSAI